MELLDLYAMWRGSVGLLIDPRIMARELVRDHPNLGWFVYGLLENRQNDVLCQVYSDLTRGGKLVETVEMWNAVPKQVGWTAANFCRPGP